MTERYKLEGGKINVDKVVADLKTLKLGPAMDFQVSDSGRLEVIIPINIRENPREEQMDIPSSASMVISDDNVRRDSLAQIEGMVKKLGREGIIKDADQVQLRTKRGGKAEEHMSWATMNGAGRDEDGPILGGRHVDAKLVIPVGALDLDKISDLYVINKRIKRNDKIDKAVAGLEGLKPQEIMDALAARYDSGKLAEAMANTLASNTQLMMDFKEAFNINAELKRQNGATKPLVIAPDEGKAKGQEQDGSWAARTSERTGRVRE